MFKKPIIWIVILLVVILIAFLFVRNNKQFDSTMKTIDDAKAAQSQNQPRMQAEPPNTMKTLKNP